MTPQRWGLLALAVVLIFTYNAAQPDLIRMRTMYINEEVNPQKDQRLRKERYGPSLEWLDRLTASSARAKPGEEIYSSSLDARVLSSLMLAGLASGFKSQVANLLWMKSDEYWHKGLLTRQNPLMEMVVTLDPQFIEAWSTAGWHWAYNIYADIPMNPAYKDRADAIRKEQERAIQVGLDYLNRGANMNPETYRLWFEWGWTRAEKAGFYDEETIALYRKAREQADAMQIERQTPQGETIKEKGGLDVVGHTISHIYESIPIIDKALQMWGEDLLKGTPQELARLRDVGHFWRLYGSDYSVIADMYRKGDEVMRSRIRRIVPDVERLVQAQEMREKLQQRASTPTGAYVTIAARYLPAWNLMQEGKIEEAKNNLIGVMNADPRYHLTNLPVMAQIYELRGDAPDAVKKNLENLRETERSSAQDIGLHFLGILYEKAAAQTTDPKLQTAYHRLAYETWYRARERKQLDFYALRKTRTFEDKFGFETPQHIVQKIKESRKRGTVEAAPKAPPNVQQYYQAPHTHSTQPAAPSTEAEPHDHDHDHSEPGHVH